MAADLGAGPLTAPLWIIGRDYGAHEQAAQQPFVGPAGDVLNDALRAAGLSRDDVRIDNLVPRQPPGNDWEQHAPGDIAWGQSRLADLLCKHRPRVIVALGNEVASWLVGEAWPDDGIQALRGYLWDTTYGRVLTTVHPAAVLREWTPWRALLDFDFKRADAERRLGAPPLAEREVRVCTALRDVQELRDAARNAPLLSVDIENTYDLQLACVGFAPTPERAWVIPAAEPWQLDAIRELCESPQPKVLQNGQYDRFFLRRFSNINLRNQTFDVMLAWHALNPELAGKKTQVGNRKAAGRRTVKSLKFLSSIYTRDQWWKQYDFASEHDRYVLCGRDVCTTLEIAQQQARQLSVNQLVSIHEFEVQLLDPCIRMAERGVRVDEARRTALRETLASARDPLLARIEAGVIRDVIAPLGSGVPKLLCKTKVCRECRNGSRKRTSCTTCGTAGKFTTLHFNASSERQVKLVLYELMRLPKRTKHGKLSSDEESLKSLLAESDKVPGATELIRGILRVSKLSTMAEIVERIAPGDDGRIRSFYNPAGTETGRFSSSESFLVRSTNLQNLPKREATEAQFDVKACLVADPGCMLVEADLSGAEAWVTAALAGDIELLTKLRAGLDIHKWTASQIFRKPIEDVTKTERHLGKVARHALNYGMQWATFQRNVNIDADRTGVAITAAQAKLIYAQYHALHPLLSAWWDKVHATVQRTGKLTTCMGRTRTFYGRSRRERLGETHREAIAYEPQSTVADVLNRGLLRWWRDHDGRLGDLLAQVHDSVLIQVRAERAAAITPIIRACLSETITVNHIAITIPVDIHVAPSWAARAA